MYIPKHFSLDEIFPLSVSNALGKKAWELMDDRILMALDRLRDRFGACFVNHNGMQYRGFRPTECREGARFSQHRYGRAIDCNFQDHTVAEVRSYILAHKTEFPEITAIENVDGWLHIDCRNCTPIMVFNP